MYSWEIEKIIKENNYSIDSHTYIDILDNSPQINIAKYDAFSGEFEIYTDDGYYWKFRVKRKWKDD